MFSILSAVGVFFADKHLKNKVEKGELKDGEEFFNGKLVIEKSYNKGLILNHFEKQPKWVLSIASAMFGVLSYLFLTTLGKRKRKLKRFGLALTLGGAASNLHDRLKKDAVTDYFVIKGLKGVIVNLGDLFIVLGSLLSLVGELVGRD